MVSQRSKERSAPSTTTTKEVSRDAQGSVRTNKVRNDVIDYTTYVQPEELEVPQEVHDRFNEEGYSLRWCRYSVTGEEDKKNIFMHTKEHGTFVDIEEVPELASLSTQIDISVAKGVVTIGDLALMKFPLEARNARRKFFEQKTQDQIDAVNTRLMENNDSKMPINNTSKSSVSKGKNAEFSD